jgi:hypothetical protein
MTIQHITRVRVREQAKHFLVDRLIGFLGEDADAVIS